MQEIKKNKFLTISTFLVCLLPPAMMTGPAMPDFIVIITGLYFLLHLILVNINIIYQKKIFFSFLIFYFFLIVSSFLSLDIWLSLMFTVPYVRFILLAFLISYLIKNNKNNFFFYFFISCVFSISILFIDSVFQFLNGKNILGFVSNIDGRVSSLFGEEFILGSYILKMSPLLLTSLFYIKIKNSKKKLLFFNLLLICFVIILISGDRAPLFLFFLFIFLLFFLLKPYRKTFIILFLLFIAFGISLLALKKNHYNRLVIQTINEIGLGEKNYSQKILGLSKEHELYQSKFYFFSAMHENYFKTAINIFKDNYFFGAGPKLYSKLSSQKKYAVDDYSAMTHPHNFYIQLLAETGLIGFLMVFLFFIYLVNKIYDLKNTHNKNFTKFNELIIGISISGLIFHLWPLITTGSFFTNYNCIMIYMCIGFFLGQLKKV